jgi:hypothetical protein
MENNTNTNGFNHDDGLKVIYAMIESAKSKIGKNYFYYLFWGYLVMATCLIEYLLMVWAKYPQHYLVWSILMPLGAVITIIFYMGQKKAVISKTFIDTTMGYFWAGWVVSFLIMLLFVNLKHEYNLILPLSMTMYGLGIFVSGGMVSFRPLILGAIVAWLASVAAFFVHYQIQLMIMAGVVIVAYIVPGHILKNKSKA